MSLPQRLSITGMGGLAALSATHWMRKNISDPAPVLAFALGVMPSLAAAFAMPLILASFVPRISRIPVTVSSRRAYSWILLFTTSGLCGWELVQTRSDRFVFDVHDILATGLGSFLAYLAFGWQASRFQVRNQAAAHRGDA
jgi:glycopeptide antibiotics resistance protein